MAFHFRLLICQPQEEAHKFNTLNVPFFYYVKYFYIEKKKSHLENQPSIFQSMHTIPYQANKKKDSTLNLAVTLQNSGP